MTREEQLLARKKRKADEEENRSRKMAAKSKPSKPDTAEAAQLGRGVEVSSEAQVDDPKDDVVAEPPKKKGWPKGKAKAKAKAKSEPAPKATPKVKAKAAAKSSSKLAKNSRAPEVEDDGKEEEMEDGEQEEEAPTAKSTAARTKQALDKGKAGTSKASKSKGMPDGDDDSWLLLTL